MPEQTKEDVASGFIEFTVVPARRIEIAPARLNPPPARAIVAAATTRIGAGISSNGATKEIPHMEVAISTATTGGGTLSSSACTLVIMRHNVELRRLRGFSRRSPRTQGYASRRPQVGAFENGDSPFLGAPFRVIIKLAFM